MRDFDSEMGKLQVLWRMANIHTSEQGFQNGVSRPWILPPQQWEEGLWPGIRSGSSYSVADYLGAHGVSRHTGSHNLKSSWVSGANLYFPFGQSSTGRDLLASFLNSQVDSRIKSVDSIELEYAESGDLSPAALLGEQGGSRGSGQTSPDIAFLVNRGTGLLLVENKLTEHSFYSCSARRKTYSDLRPANPDTSPCNDVGALMADVSLCHQQTWSRKYWQQLQPVINAGRLLRLPYCPAATAGYQLFRQQALAEGIAQSGRYEFVVSCVAIDQRNERLACSLKSSGIADIRDWGTLFDGRASFTVITHQDWVQWVRTNDTGGEWASWAQWISERYEL